MAEEFLRQPVKRAVLTVPAHLGDAQRQASYDAATMAGLKVLRVIHEPAAAIFAYGLDKRRDDEAIDVLVFDLGGSTLDISLVNIDYGILEIKAASSGSARFGGECFDQRLLAHFVEEFKTEKKKDVSGCDQALGRLRSACERAKITLSTSSSATVEVDSLFEGVDFVSSVTRARFEELCDDIFRQCTASIQRVLDDAKVARADVREIIMVGGSSHIPKIQEIVRTTFDGKELLNHINPGEVVAHGAAVQAAILGAHVVGEHMV